MDYRAPGLEYVMTMHLTLVPGSLAKIDNLPAGGSRWSISLAGGTFEGPELNGRVLPGGIENPHFRPDNVLVINARRLLETNDGERIYMQNRGFRRAYRDPAKMSAWLTKSEPVSAADMYLRVVSTFETSSGKYDWLTRHIVIGMLIDSDNPSGSVSGNTLHGPTLRYFKVL
ncbi:MAG: DUF3237 domain-containing protein [Burkholderiales bacterium]|nr:DUF3237 domain-containing protein [Burkholderiales bacterium]